MVTPGKTGKLPNPVYEIGLPLHSQGSDFHMVWWGTGTERGYNTGSAYTFKEINTDEVDETMLSMPCKNNGIEILSFPYDVDMTELGGFYAGEGEGTPYSLNNLTINEDTPTVIDFACPNKGESLHYGLNLWHKKADGRTFCDYGFHMTLRVPPYSLYYT